MLLNDLQEKGLIHPPSSSVVDNCCYLTITGSIAYGAADTNKNSDMDLFGFCIPSKTQIFPHLAGQITGFGSQIKQFEQYQHHHIWDQAALGGKGREYDLTIYSIVKYFNLLMENNPSCIDTLFTPQECIVHTTQVGNLIRENRKLFLHKGCFPKFKGYSLGQMHKMGIKTPKGKRKEDKEKNGMDTKYAMHLVRLLYEAEMILAEGDLDLRRHSEHLKAIRRGEVSEKEILEWASGKEKQLESLYHESKLSWGPDEDKIKGLLLKCLEIHYGNLDKCITLPEKNLSLLRQIKELLESANLQ